MKKRTRVRSLPISIVLLSILSALTLGCGYNLVGQGNNIPEDVRDIYVETLENSTSRSQVEQILTQAISEEVVTRRRFNVVNSADGADAILSGQVIDFNLRPVSFDQNGLANNFEIVIRANMKFQRVPSPGGEEGEVLWENTRYIFRQDYLLEENANYFDRENLAIEETSERFADTLITDLLEGF